MSLNYSVLSSILLYFSLAFVTALLFFLKRMRKSSKGEGNKTMEQIVLWGLH